MDNSKRKVIEGAKGSDTLTVLIVDDDRSNRLILRAWLAPHGYRVIAAENGQDAVELFLKEQPDIVLMDIMMPVMDGYEATRLIKAHASGQFVPVIFLTAATNDDALVRCVHCGGDDFLTKPYNHVILKAKIDALMRVRDLYGTVMAQKDKLARYKSEKEREYELGEKLLANMVHTGYLDAPNIQYLLSPMSVFNGDLLLAAPTPSGGLRILLGDFTGHGLSAAIGALPMTDIFYGMTAKGFPIGDVVSEANNKLQDILPTGRFCAACLLELDHTYTTLSVWNGGIPDVLIYRQSAGDVKTRLKSKHLPLAVVGNAQLDTTIEVIDVTPEDRVFIYSDGVLEAQNPDGEMFGQRRLEESFAVIEKPEELFTCIRDYLTSFRSGESQKDDITLVEVLCDPLLAISHGDSEQTGLGSRPATDWRIALELGADTLRAMDPLPMVSQMLLGYQGLKGHWEKIYTILAELFNNALDHGLLNLDSSIKNSPGGFGRYYATRQNRLAALRTGRVKIDIRNTPQGTGGRLMLRVEDSGPGFAYHARAAKVAEKTAYCGRGIPLVRSLCDELVYHGAGNTVEAVYLWR